MYIERIGRRRLAIGLSWFTLDQNEDEKVGLQRLAKHNGKYGVILYASQALVGFTEKKCVKHLSAAVALSHVNKNALVIHKINRKQYWICMTDNGLVVPITDILKNTDDVLEAVRGLTEYIQASKNTFEVFAPDFEELFSNELESDVLVKCSFSGDIVEHIDGYEPDNKSKIRDLLYQPFSAKNIIRAVVYAAVVYALFEIYASYMHNYRSVDDIIETTSFIDSQEPEEVVIPPDVLAVQAINVVLTSHTPEQRFDIYRRFIKRGLYRDGYKSVGVSVTTEPAIRVRWERIGIGTVQDIISSDEEAISRNATKDGNNVELVYKAESELPGRVITKDDLTLTKGSFLNLMSDFQLSHVKWSFTSDSNSGAGGNPLNILESNPGANVISQHFFEIETKGFWDINDIIRMLSKYPTIAIGQIESKIENNTYLLKIKGVLYEYS